LQDEIELGRAAREVLSLGVGAHQRHSGGHVVGTDVLEGSHRYSLPRPATSRIAATMFGYAPQRQRLPLMNSRISSSEPARPSCSSATADMICPGVQYPHCSASCRTNASCIG